MIIKNIGKDLDTFGIRKLKRLFQKFMIWHDVNNNFMEDEPRKSIAFRCFGENMKKLLGLT